MTATMRPRVTQVGDTVPSRAQLLSTALRVASTAARNFSIHEAQGNAQRERYATLADILEAQVRSLRAEVT